ncbi:MAG: hypothetical protein M3Y23_06245 [Actinomycetota bacterium]|nr:hypothetical protein [Actinomycetota bacterium]
MIDSDQNRAYELAYRESIRALDQQATVVDGFRIRAGILISSAALTTSFFGAVITTETQLTVAGWLGVASFLMVVGLSLAILWPRGWEFSFSPVSLIATYIETVEPLPLPAIHRDLALHMHASYSENQTGIERMALWSKWAVALLVLEVLFWVADRGIGTYG